MKKIMYLLAMLCVASMGFAQSYDYDRIVPEPARPPRPWVEVALDKQVVPFPSGITYHRFTLMDNTNPIDIGDMAIEFDQDDNDPTQITIKPILKDDADVEFRAHNPVQFFVESGTGEKIVSVNGEKEYTTFKLLKMVWTDPQGEVHKKHIGMMY